MKSLLRKVRLKLGKFFLDKKVQGEAFPINPKIIVLQQDGKIGDYIVSSFLFRELKKYNPQIVVDVVCSPNNANLFASNPFIDNYFVLNKKAFLAYTKMGIMLARRHYDILINLPVLLRNRDLWLTRLINAKNNIGYKKENYKIFNLNIHQENLHFSQVYAKAAELCGVSDINTQYEIPFYSHKKEEIISFLQMYQLDNYIVVNFFGAAKSRKFTEQNINKFLDYFSRLPQKFLLLTYPGMTVQLKKQIENYENIFLYEKTENIFDSIELLKHSKLVISPDTSIIHIASGLNKAIIAFYKLGDKENFTHWHPNSKNKTHILSFKDNVNEIEPEEIKLEWLE